MDRFSHIETWVFDLDGTLYDAKDYIWENMAERMTEYIADLLAVPKDEACNIRQHYYTTYGTTLCGLMKEHDIDPADYMTKAHDFDVSPIVKCETTIEKLSHLPGRKLIYTNASRDWMNRMVKHLEIDHHFDGDFAIEDSDYLPKPHVDAYHTFLERHDVNPKTACMFEDTERNLKTAHDLGMTTVWVHHGRDDDHDHVHHKTEKLHHWLNDVIKEGK